MCSEHYSQKFNLTESIKTRKKQPVFRKIYPNPLQLLHWIQNVLANYKYSQKVMLYNIMNTTAVVKICINEQESNKSWKRRHYPLSFISTSNRVTSSNCNNILMSAPPKTWNVKTVWLYSVHFSQKCNLTESIRTRKNQPDF